MLIYLLLFVGAFVAAAISGAAGFGGALLLLPLLTRAVGPTLAVPLLTLAQTIGNLSRVAFGFRAIRWRSVGYFLLGAVPLSVVGALSFVALPATLVTRLIGVAIIVFVALRAFNRLHVTPGPRTLIVGGGVVGALSGLIGSAGPLGAAVFLSLNLPAVAYIASEAATATVMHIVKIIVYQRYIRLDRSTWLLGLFVGSAMIAGTAASKRVIQRMSPARFRRFVEALLLVIALQMIVLG
jgi:hypothetical protein